MLHTVSQTSDSDALVPEHRVLSTHDHHLSRWHAVLFAQRYVFLII